MHSILLKSLTNRCLLIVLCIVSIYFTIWNFSWTNHTDDRSGIKIGLLFLNNSFVSKRFLQANFQLSDKNMTVYRCYVSHENIGKNIRSTNIDIPKNLFYVQTSANTITENANLLANKAYTDGMDYLVLISDNGECDSLFKDGTVNFKQELKAHIHVIPNVGVIVHTCINREERQGQHTKLIILQKSHMEIFNDFFPQYLDFEVARKWIVDIYKPYHITYTKPQQLSTQFQSIRFEHKNESIIKNVELAKNTINGFILNTYRLFVVSYSLYGSDTRYTDGAIENAELIKVVYPSWKMWIYHDDTVPETILTSVCRQDHITCINMTGTMLKNKMSWRFLVASVPFILRYIIRDIDSRLSVREGAAVDEWIQSGKKFHVMRDHPAHSYHPISGGMWGGTREAIPDIKKLLESHLIGDQFRQDMKFLRDKVWPIARTSIYQHDSFSCDKFGGGHPFPTHRIGFEYVGGVFINGKLRKGNTHILKKAKAPEHCIPNTR